MSKQYLCLIASCDTEFTDILLAELDGWGNNSSLQTETGFEAYWDEESLLQWLGFDGQSIPGELDRFLTELQERYPQAQFSYYFQWETEQNWNEEWEKNFESIVVADQVYVYAEFHEPRPDLPYQIKISPKMAFGTGHHATTYLMLHFQLELDHQNKKVLDAGCGTGILAIMAGLRGAQNITAYDNSPWAVENSQENFALNNETGIRLFEGTVQDFFTHDKLNRPKEQFDLILANINRGVLLQEMNEYARLLPENGRILLSGFFEEDEPKILQAANHSGLELLDKKVRNNWCALLLKRT